MPIFRLLSFLPFIAFGYCLQTYAFLRGLISFLFAAPATRSGTN